MFYPIGFTELPNPSSAFMKVDMDGSATVYTGAADIGQGSTTALMQIVSEVTGIPHDQIRIVSADTKYSPYDAGSVASRVTLIAGKAVLRAAEECRDMLFRAASVKWGLIIGEPEKTMKVDKGVIYADAFREYTMTIAEAAHFSYQKMGRPVIGKGEFNVVTIPLAAENGHGKPYGTHVFAAQIAYVTVDDETGWYSVDKIYAVHDCGKALNPMLLKGQIDGGVGNGVGFACMEKIETKDGRVVNDQFTDYMVPTSLDVPPIISDVVERFDPVGVFGAKGIGEPSLLPTASAICNAIFDAVGVMITDLPITPEKVLLALKKKKKTDLKVS
jgi:CO/xanthine dehydrogenase Mo-binding subunit